ncbi:MAG: T9SS type A sorting domain-containing protein, partial [Saprospiraceae bacterium]
QRGEFGQNCYREKIITINNDDLPYPSEQTGSLNCNNLVFDSFNNQISIDGLTAEYNKVEYIGPGTNWKVKTLCDYTCASKEYSPDLPAGNYTIKVNQKDEQTQFVNRSRVGGHESYCYQEGTVNISGSSNRNSNNQITLDLYPNPARSTIQFNTLGFQGKKGKLLLYNMLGHLVKRIPTMSFEEETVAIDLSDFENGMYLLSIDFEKSPPINRRFIVEHLK